MSNALERPRPTVDTTSMAIGAMVGVPLAVGVGAVMAMFRSFFNTTNAALVLMVVVVAVAAFGGRAAGIVTALAAVASFDFFHTRPYLSLAIDSRDDIETTVWLLVAAVIVGTLASAWRHARTREASAHSDVRRIHRVSEAAVSGSEPAHVIALAQHELGELLGLRECRFEALPVHDDVVRLRLGRNGAIKGRTSLRFGLADGGRGGFELPEEGVELPVLARGQHIGRFVLLPTPGVPVSLDQRMVAVAIADQVAAVWIPAGEERSR